MGESRSSRGGGYRMFSLGQRPIGDSMAGVDEDALRRLRGIYDLVRDWVGKGNPYNSGIVDKGLSIPLNQSTIQEFIRGIMAAHRVDGDFQEVAPHILNTLIQGGFDNKLTLDVSCLPPLNNLCENLMGKDVTIVGCSGHNLGRGLRGSVVRVMGDAGEQVGLDAVAGEIHVVGRIKSVAELSPQSRLRIIQAGELIWPKPPGTTIKHTGRKLA